VLKTSRPEKNVTLQQAHLSVFFSKTQPIPMQKYLLPVLVSLLLCFTTSCSKKTTDAATTAASGGTDYAALAATYKKNPEALRQLIEDCEVTEQQLATTQQQLNQYRSQSGSTEQDLNALRNNLASEQQANDQLRQPTGLPPAQTIAWTRMRMWSCPA
jgi:septal ring factor EnvC (AmiA/AmiB activator)